MNVPRRIAGLTVTAVVCIGFDAPPSGAHLYRANCLYCSKPGIYRIDVEGSFDKRQSGQVLAVKLPKTAKPQDVAVDDRRIYWIDDGTGDIGRARLDGSEVNPTLIDGASSSVQWADGIAVSPEYVFWVWGYWVGDQERFDWIGRANLDGTGANPNFLRIVGASPGDVEVWGRYLYWAGNEAIGRATVDGTEVDNRFIKFPAVREGVPGGEIGEYQSPAGLHVGPQGLHWATQTTDLRFFIGRANIDGTAPAFDFLHPGRAWDVAASDKFIYWVGRDVLGRAGLDGEPQTDDYTSVDSPGGLAIDDRHDPGTSRRDGPKARTAKRRPIFKFGSSAQRATFECALDRKPFKPCTSPRRVKRLRLGRHTFRARAVDGVGIFDATPAVWKFRVVRR